MISIHAPREGGDAMSEGYATALAFISIHAPREGGDSRRHGLDVGNDISIHAPREGGRRCSL